MSRSNGLGRVDGVIFPRFQRDRAGRPVERCGHLDGAACVGREAVRAERQCGAEGHVRTGVESDSLFDAFCDESFAHVRSPAGLHGKQHGAAALSQGVFNGLDGLLWVVPGLAAELSDCKNGYEDWDTHGYADLVWACYKSLMCVNFCDQFRLAGEPGFEPRLAESESAVLPLNYSPAAGGAPPADQGRTMEQFLPLRKSLLRVGSTKTPFAAQSECRPAIRLRRCLFPALKKTRKRRILQNWGRPSDNAV